MTQFKNVIIYYKIKILNRIYQQKINQKNNFCTKQKNVKHSSFLSHQPVPLLKAVAITIKS